jgi:hypothetical protein
MDTKSTNNGESVQPTTGMVDTSMQQSSQPAQTQPIPAPQPMVQTPMSAPVMANGGVSGSGSLRSFLKEINWVDVGILMLGTAALYYTIYYYRIKIKAQKRELADIGNKMDMMEAKVSAIQKQQQSQSQTTNKKRVSF